MSAEALVKEENMNEITLYTMTQGLDIELIKPPLWKNLIIQQKALEKTLETYLIVTKEDKEVLIYVSESEETIRLLTKLLGIESISTTEEIKPEIVAQYGNMLSPEDILVIARLITEERILPDDSHLWFH